MDDHFIKYENLCKQYGVKWDADSPRLIGETIESLTAKYQADPHLNNVPIKAWDILAYSFKVYNDYTGLSLSELVCMQKHAAITLVHSYLIRQYGGA
jgi:hypothetical protein